MASFKVQSVLKRLGADIRVARKKRRMSVADFAERLGVSDKTLMKLESGDGGVRIETFVMAFMVLGELHRLEDILDPARDETGLMLDHARLPQRIVSRRKKSKDPSEVGQPVTDPIDPNGVAF